MNILNRQRVRVMWLAVLLAVGAVQARDFEVQVHGEGQPMLLIPGLSNHAAVWDETVARYQDRYRTHAVTLPGFAGVAPMSYEGDYLDAVTAQLLAYIDAQKLHKPVIVGHSLGGYVAMKLAIARPKAFDRLVIVDSLPFMAAMQVPTATEESIKPMAEMMRKNMNSNDETARAASLDMLLPSMITDPERIALAKRWGMDSDPHTVAQAMYELMTRDLRDELQQVKIPVLVMGAWIAYQGFGMTRQRLLDSYGAQYEALDDLTLKATDSGRHFIMWDDPEFFFTEIDAFLARP